MEKAGSGHPGAVQALEAVGVRARPRVDGRPPSDWGHSPPRTYGLACSRPAEAAPWLSTLAKRFHFLNPLKGDIQMNWNDVGPLCSLLLRRVRVGEGEVDEFFRHYRGHAQSWGPSTGQHFCKGGDRKGPNDKSSLPHLLLTTVTLEFLQWHQYVDFPENLIHFTWRWNAVILNQESCVKC